MARMSWLLVLSLVLLWNQRAHADPCGMVPPVYIGPGDPIERVGPQKTYVFYKKGIESIVLRPAFRGKVEHFGMLIPFPSVPAIRKVPDNIFKHIAAAIDPPEVEVEIETHVSYRLLSGSGGLRGALSAKGARGRSAAVMRPLQVLKQEAVGMYQVAVLRAGRLSALKRWMKSHKYVYPKGMDKVVLSYIRARWCFVVVKTRVAQKRGVSARPGMRKARPLFPKGAIFRGAVQAMGFRFRTRRLVVPMRLSAFNKGRLRNVVYLLTQGPKRIKHIPTHFIRRQLSGKMLHQQLFAPLPLRVIGGRPKQITTAQWETLQPQRDPSPHSGLARVLFASDLLAVKRRRLSLPHEETKKVLLQIEEKLDLRGKEIDLYNRKALSVERAQTVALALGGLKDMTMTVVDGDFPRHILARENLTFTGYQMPRSKNKARFYHAPTLGPKIQKTGRLSRWWGPASARKWLTWRRLQKPTHQVQSLIKNKAPHKWIRWLAHPTKGKNARQKLIAMGAQALPWLRAVVEEDTSLVRRGWAVVVMSQMPQARAFLKQKPPSGLPALVRTWWAAGYLQGVTTLEELLQQSRWLQRDPPLIRPFSIRAATLASKVKLKTLALLKLASRYPTLRQPLFAAVTRAGPDPLIKLMFGHKKNNIRRLAAGYLGGLARTQANAVAKGIREKMTFLADAKKVPWDGGALFFPRVAWPPKEAKPLAADMLSWMLWAQTHRKRLALRALLSNYQNIPFLRAAGLRGGWRGSPSRLLYWWGRANGCAALLILLNEHPLATRRHHKYIFRRLRCL